MAVDEAATDVEDAGTDQARLLDSGASGDSSVAGGDALSSGSLPCNPAASVVPISAGALHTCGITAAGGVKCWGDNTYGKLGNDVTSFSAVPMDVLGLTNILAVSAGVSHTCAVTDAGAALCWGDNRDGELGNGSTTNSATPVGVVGLSTGVVAISAGDGHTCALTTAGAVECWGDGSHGQLGNGGTANSSVPTDVAGLAECVVSVSAGTYHTCAATAAGGVKYWGDSSYGELGNFSPPVAAAFVPTDVIGAPSTSIAVKTAEIESCILTSAGSVSCWGAGDLGDGTTMGSSEPVNVSGLLSPVTAISVGESHACAVTVQGGAMCWGNNLYGQLGNGTTAGGAVPVVVSGLDSGVTAIAAGWGGQFESWSVNGGNRHTCAVIQGGAIQCWGSNDSGQLGNGSTTSSSVPVEVVGF